MQAYIIAAIDDEMEEPVAYFDGSVLQDDLQNSFIYTSKGDARRVIGAGLQSRSDDKDLRVIKVDRVIKLA